MAASASAPGGEPQKQLLSIIRDFASEKSHGERTVSGLKRRLDDVVAEADAATAELEAAKRAREAAEMELRGSQVQASIAAATIQALEATISHLQEEITKMGSELEELKSKEDSERDEFISQMLEMNARIRQFQQMASVELARKCSEVSADGEQGKATDGNQGKGTDCHNVNNKNETDESEDMVIDLADKLSSIEAEMHALEEEYRKDLLVHKQVHQFCTVQLTKDSHKAMLLCKGYCVSEGKCFNRKRIRNAMACQELADVQAKRALIEAVMEETKQFQQVGGRVAEMEKVQNSVAEELQRRYVCSGCGTNNMGATEEAALTSSN